MGISTNRTTATHRGQGISTNRTISTHRGKGGQGSGGATGGGSGGGGSGYPLSSLPLRIRISSSTAVNVANTYGSLKNTDIFAFLPTDINNGYYDQVNRGIKQPVYHNWLTSSTGKTTPAETALPVFAAAHPTSGNPISVQYNPEANSTPPLTVLSEYNAMSSVVQNNCKPDAQTKANGGLLTNGFTLWWTPDIPGLSNISGCVPYVQYAGIQGQNYQTSVLDFVTAVQPYITSIRNAATLAGTTCLVMVQVSLTKGTAANCYNCLSGLSIIPDVISIQPGDGTQLTALIDLIRPNG